MDRRKTMSMDRPHVAATSSSSIRRALTMLTILSVAAMMCGDEGQVRGWSKYEEMGPLAVTSFQTQHPELVYVVQCNPWTVAIAPSPPDDAGYQKPPTRLFVVAPSAAGRYPVLLFKHGFLLANCAYSSILRHVASYGYIAVAPQADVMQSTDATEEIQQTIQVEQWIPGNLSQLLTAAGVAPEAVPDTGKLMIAGHSRGGKVAYAMALGLGGGDSSGGAAAKYAGLFVLDPVDGTTLGPSNPPIVTSDNAELGFPALVLGTGYGGERTGIVMPPCAPPCCGHAAYANATAAPTLYHLEAPDFGHLDFLDGSGRSSELMCGSGSAEHAPLRDASAALLVAFFRSALAPDDDRSFAALDDAISDASIRLVQHSPPASSSSCSSGTASDVCPA